MTPAAKAAANARLAVAILEFQADQFEDLAREEIAHGKKMLVAGDHDAADRAVVEANTWRDARARARETAQKIRAGTAGPEVAKILNEEGA